MGKEELGMSWDKHETHEYVWPSIEAPAGPHAWTIKQPPAANWQWCFGGDWFACTFSVPMKTGPSWFHRLMQKWILGIHWRRI